MKPPQTSNHPTTTHHNDWQLEVCNTTKIDRKVTQKLKTNWLINNDRRANGETTKNHQTTTTTGSKFCNKIFDIGVNFIEEPAQSDCAGMAGSKRQNTLMQPKGKRRRPTLTHTHTHTRTQVGPLNWKTPWPKRSTSDCSRKAQKHKSRALNLLHGWHSVAANGLKCPVQAKLPLGVRLGQHGAEVLSLLAKYASYSLHRTTIVQCTETNKLLR